VLGLAERPVRAGSGFHHQALFYAGDDEFVAATLPFLREGVAAGDPTFVLVEERRIEQLRAGLSADAEHITFADMRTVGRNPARIIPAWQAFVDTAGSADRLRGIGEPIWSGRTDAELVECRLHEALLNVAFEGGRALHLLCPYDVEALDPEVVRGAQHTHPFVGVNGGDEPSPDYAGERDVTRIFNDGLPRPATEPDTRRFSVGPLHDFRTFVADRARSFGMSSSRIDNLVLAANEMATNSILHGGGSGLVRVWGEDDSFLCEIRDAGHIDNVMVGRVRPPRDEMAGRGVWMANQLCDLVQIRSSDTGTVVRLHMRSA
jgi:anti-sigma regulatory factor (Ser/Thr protein kinase)